VSSGNDLGARGEREQLHLLLYKQVASPLICFLFHVMIAFCWWQHVMWTFWGYASWVVCSRSPQHPSHVGGMHLRWIAFFYHQSQLYLASAYAPFYEDIATLIILDHPI
jgi:hypothetical protein